MRRTLLSSGVSSRSTCTGEWGVEVWMTRRVSGLQLGFFRVKLESYEELEM